MKRTIARRVILLVCIISAGLLPFPTAQSLDLNLRASAGLDATVGLGALFSINDSLEVARLARKALAIEAWGKAMSAQPHMISLFNTEVTELNGPANIIDYNKAVAEGRLANIVAEIKNINDAAKYAAQLDVAFDRQYQSLKTDLQAKLNSTYNLYANAAKVLNAAHGKGMRKPTTQYPPELPREQL